jgi:hypothetical protein
MKQDAGVSGTMRYARKTSHILYLLFNWACVIVYAYQVYGWITKGSWTRIPTGILLSGSAASPFMPLSRQTGTILSWMLNVELAYTLCALAIIFHALRWFLGRKAR